MTDTTPSNTEKLGFWKRLLMAVDAFERTEEDDLWAGIRQNRETIRGLEEQIAKLQAKTT